MRAIICGMLVVCFFGFTTSMYASGKTLELNYNVDLTKIKTDSFFVNLAIKGFSSDSAVFQFASTAPGTYRIMDVGRFESGFKAYNASGISLPVYRLSTNQYVIKNAQTLSRIVYQIEDSYDSKFTDHPILPMSGSNLEKDNALINGQMVFGFIKGYQSNPIQIRFDYPKEWKVGTALEERNGTYAVQSFDELVDSPFMFGRLTHSSSKVGGAAVNIFCYSQNDMITADSLQAKMKDMLNAAEKFIGKLPVDHYTFLFHFRKDIGPIFGAWEHNYSSYYAMPEAPFNESVQQIMTFASHEFFHVITPLNIHSEIIEKFNFERPVPSQHLWLYEGTTEWAAQMMQIRGGLISQDEFTQRITQKLNSNDSYRQDVSLVNLSLGSYGDLKDQYGNIYMKGALTAMFLDMRLLELSKGKTGLREVIQKLSKKYGAHKAFPENGFFDEFVKMTYPEIGEFFDRYVKGSEPLPVKEYLAKAGFDYRDEAPSGTYVTSRGVIGLQFIEGKIMVTEVDSTNEVNRQTGIKKGDELLSLIFKGTEKSLLDPEYNSFKNTIQPGDPFALKVRRNGNEMELKGIAKRLEVINKHVISPMAQWTKEQQEFRTYWLTNR